MLFLNTWMLLGLAGVAVPVLIHLLNRRQAREVDWGAILFLLHSMMSRRRRLLLEEVLLLASRCALVAVAALALARPFTPAGSRVPWLLVLPAGLLALTALGASFALASYPVWRRRLVWLALGLALLAAACVALERWLNLRRFGRAAPRDVALVLDGSSSMQMAVAGRSNFARAVEEAQQIVQSAPRGMAFSLIVGGAVPDVLAAAPTTDRRHLLRLLSEAQPVHGTMPVLDTLAVAAVTLAQGYQGAKQIVMIGDGQRVGWNTGDAEAWAYLRAAFARLPAKPQVVWRRLPLPAAIRNVAVDAVVFGRAIVGTDRAVPIEVRLVNTGTEAVTPRAVRLNAGGRTQTDASLGQIPPGVARTVTFEHRFERAGAAVVEASVDVDDELPADDRAIRVVQVLRRLRVLVVDGEPSARFLDRPGSFLALGLLPDATRLRQPAGGPAPALPPGTAAPEELLVDPELVPSSVLGTRRSFDDYVAVALADVPSLPPAAAASLGEYVCGGGGLLLALGPRADPAFYNAWRAGGERVLPFEMERFAVATASNRPAIDLATATHPVLKAIATASDLDGASIERWWRLRETGDAAARAGARLSNGGILLAERDLDRGRVLEIPLSLDASSGTLVSRRSFVPLAHELIYHLARPMAVNLNLAPSRSLTLNLGSGQSERQSAGGGLLGEYFADGRMRRPALVRVDPGIAFDWGEGSPGRGVPADRFVVRWTGALVPPASQTYRFFLTANDSARLWLDGHLLMPAAREATVDLSAGRRYDLRIEYRENEGPASVQLQWESAGMPRQVVPPAYLSPVRGRVGSAAAEIDTTVTGADGRPTRARYASSADGLSLRVDRALPPGLYRAQVPELLAPRLAALTGPESSLPFSVQVDGQESRLDPLGIEEVDFARQYVDIVPAGGLEDVLKALTGNAFGRELWRTLAWAALVLLILEVALTRWIAIQRRTGEEGRAVFEESHGPSEQFRQELARVRGGTVNGER